MLVIFIPTTLRQVLGIRLLSLAVRRNSYLRRGRWKVEQGTISSAPDVENTRHSADPTNIVLTLSRMRYGNTDPTHQVGSPNMVWKTTLTEQGPASMLLSQTDLHTPTCRGWGPGAEQAAAGAPSLCGGADDPTGFERQHPLVERLSRQYVGLRIPKRKDFRGAGPGDHSTTGRRHSSHRKLETPRPKVRQPGTWLKG